MKLYNTLAGVAQEFTPAAGKNVKMYVCGVTPYSSTHVGHALSYVVFDVLRRYLEYLGYQVRHVQNFTDVDDKIIQRAQEQGIGVEELADRYIECEVARLIAYNVAYMQGEGQVPNKEASMSKVFGSETQHRHL